MKNEQWQIISIDGHFSSGGSSPKFVKNGHGKIWHTRKHVEMHVSKRARFLKNVGSEFKSRLTSYDNCRVMHSYVDDFNVYHCEYFNIADFVN